MINNFLSNQNKRWSEEERRLLIDKLNSGKNYKEIAYDLGRTYRSIEQRAHIERTMLKGQGKWPENAKPKKHSYERILKEPKVYEPKKETVTKGMLSDAPIVHNSQQLSDIFSTLVVIAVGVWATAAGLFLAVIQ